jgi:hypothetical protein
LIVGGLGSTKSGPRGGRWLTRLRRAFHALEKSQRRIASLERQLRQVESGQAGA